MDWRLLTLLALIRIGSGRQTGPIGLDHIGISRRASIAHAVPSSSRSRLLCLGNRLLESSLRTLRLTNLRYVNASFRPFARSRLIRLCSRIGLVRCLVSRLVLLVSSSRLLLILESLEQLHRRGSVELLIKKIVDDLEGQVHWDAIDVNLGFDVTLLQDL